MPQPIQNLIAKGRFNSMKFLRLSTLEQHERSAGKIIRLCVRALTEDLKEKDIF